jgi:hypothetical protein
VLFHRILIFSSNSNSSLKLYSQRQDCELYDTEQARRDFGSYAPEIIEGRKTTEQDAQQTSQTNNVDIKMNCELMQILKCLIHFI